PPSAPPSLHDALPISTNPSRRSQMLRTTVVFPEPLPPATPMMTGRFMLRFLPDGVLFGYAPSIVAILSGDCKMAGEGGPHGSCRSEEHTSELQSRQNL